MVAVPVLESAAPISVICKARADYIADKLISKGVDSARIAKVFAGGIEEYSPNEANRHTKVVLSLR